jgi:hypothetical protein
LRVRTGTATSHHVFDPLLVSTSELGKTAMRDPGKIGCHVSTAAPDPASFVTMSLVAGTIWQPRPAVIAWDAARVRLTAAVLSCRTAESAFFHHDSMGETLATRRLETIRAMLVGPDHFRLAVQRLAGLGPGLTPSGSDWLVGCATALWHLSHRQPWEGTAASLLAVLTTRDEVLATTRLSQTLVSLAARGISAEDLIFLVESFSPRDIRRRAFEGFGIPILNRVLAWGHTSGADVALGLADGARVVLGLAGCG